MPPKAKSRGQNQNAPSSGAGSAKGGGKSKSQSAFSDATRLFGESKRLIQMGAKESMKASGPITMSRLMSKGVVSNDLDETSSGLRVTLNRDGQVTMLESCLESCRHSNAFRIGEGAWSRINAPQWEWVDDSLASEDIFAGMNRFVSKTVQRFVDGNVGEGSAVPPLNRLTAIFVCLSSMLLRLQELALSLSKGEQPVRGYTDMVKRFKSLNLDYLFSLLTVRRTGATQQYPPHGTLLKACILGLVAL